MRLFAIAALALAAACSQPAQTADTAEPAAPALSDAAGNRIEQLTARENAQCTSDGVWCVELMNGQAVVRRNGEQTAAVQIEGDDEAGVWPSIVLAGDQALVGVTRKAVQTYSGGGGSAMQVTLYDISGASPAAVLTAPLDGSIMIRACFDEEDVEARRQVCHDEYEFSGTLGLDASVSEGAPRFILVTEATSYPGKRDRATSDVSQDPPLTADDIERVRDETCSYRRVASRQGGAYVWDAPLPDCSSYLEP